MRFIKIIFFLIITSLASFAQTSDVFRMVSNGIPSWTTLNDSTYVATVGFQSDLTGESYLANQITNQFRVFTALGEVYRVDSVANATFSSAQLFIVEYNEATSAPITMVMVFDPDGRETVPDVPFGSSGSTSQLGAAVVTYNSSISGGGSVTAGQALTLNGSVMDLGGTQTENIDINAGSGDTLSYNGAGSRFMVDNGAVLSVENSEWEGLDNDLSNMVITITSPMDVNLALPPDGTIKVIINASNDAIDVDPIGATTVDDQQGYTLAINHRIIVRYNAGDDNWVVIGGSTFLPSYVQQDSLVIGNFTTWIERTGGSISGLTNPSSGEYDITLNDGADLEHISIKGNNTTLNGSNEMVITLGNETNNRSRRVLVQLYDAQNGALVDQQGTGTVHTVAVVGAETTITIPGLNGFGSTGFYVEIR